MFIVIEGIEAVGKSSLHSYIADYLRNKGMDVVQTREPGGTEISERIRDTMLSHYTESMNPMTELLLAQAARVQHVETLIKPALAKGAIVVSDRFVGSSFAYQGAARGLGFNTVFELYETTLKDFQPDLVLWLDCDLDVANSRKAKRGIADDRIEKEKSGFFKDCQVGFELYANCFPEIVFRIDAGGSIEDVQEEATRIIEERLSRHKKP